MALFHGVLTRLKRPAGGSDDRLVTIPNLLWRHKIVSLLIVVVLLIGLVYLVSWSRQKCGHGLTAVGSPYVCVGLNRDSTAFRDIDPLADLEKTSRTTAEQFLSRSPPSWYSTT